ncbi:fatty-acid amide hydrolase 2-B [Nephila pilipes]|uniref:Fatty-acid amide hydrolase 2-B n=1 Tax=Nephila pilipes TaxID=299642 RepID=A0A8X6QD73_NEPPI|nr:fatty-acid amide hydrolase 2-B [Nephila pilipes]
MVCRASLNCENVIRTYIKRIQEVEPYINATVEQCFDDALKAAKEVDELIASKRYSSEELAKEKPLLGVPFTVKILIRVKGLRHTSGSRLNENVIATEDAPTVALYKEAGAIIIATTNAPEMGLHVETVNHLHGRTCNPYDTTRTCGGSSGTKNFTNLKFQGVTSNSSECRRKSLSVQDSRSFYNRNKSVAPGSEHRPSSNRKEHSTPPLKKCMCVYKHNLNLQNQRSQQVVALEHTDEDEKIQSFRVCLTSATRVAGGESALIAAGGSVLGLGNDLVGSVRIPAHFTGIFAHKPSQGLVSNLGSVPPDRVDSSEKSPYTEVYKVIATGPMCRYAEDLIVSMRILTARDDMRETFGKEINYQKFRIFYLKEIKAPMVPFVEADIAAGMQNAISYFESHYNISAKEIKLPLLFDMFRCGWTLLTNLFFDAEDTLTGGRGIHFNMKLDLLKSVFGKSTLCFMTLMIMQSRQNPLLYRESKIHEYKRMIEEIRNELNNILDEDTVLLLPTLPITAPYHHAVIPLMGKVCYTIIFSYIGFPSTHCPIGYNKHGLPFGIQIVGCKNNDALTIACAVELEKAFGGWRAPRSTKRDV